MSSPMQRVSSVVSSGISNYLTNKKTWSIIYNVKDYGAKSDGIADDTTAIQQTINAAAESGGYGDVYIPRGTLYDLGSLNVPQSINLMNFESNIDFNARPDASTFYVRRNAKFIGGSTGFVNGAIYTFTEVGPGVTSFEWGITSAIDVYANAGEHVALYGKATKVPTSGNSSIWGSVLEVIDATGVDSTGTSFIGLEINMHTNGDNANGNRVGVDIISRTFGTGDRGELTYGMRLSGDGKFVTGIELTSDMVTALNISSNGNSAIGISGSQVFGINMQGSKTVAIATSNASTSEALRMAAGQAISFEGTGSIQMKYNNTSGFIEFYRGATRFAYIDTNGVDHAM